MGARKAGATWGRACLIRSTQKEEAAEDEANREQAVGQGIQRSYSRPERSASRCRHRRLRSGYSGGISPRVAMKITEFLKSAAVLPKLTAKTKPELLQELGGLLARVSPSVDPAKLVAVLEERERLGSTGIGEGVAIPHGKLPGLPSLIAAFGVAREGLDFNSVDGKPTYLFFVLVAPENSAGLHVKALALIARLFRNAKLREAVMKAETGEEIYGLLAAEDAKV